MEGLVAELVKGAREEMARVAELGGAVKAVDYMKAALVESHRERWRRIESGELTVVGMNRFQSTEPSPLTADADGGILVVDPQVEAEQRAALERVALQRDSAAVDGALAELARVARDDSENIMPATIAAARAGATTGEWAQTLRDVFGEYRAPTGVGDAAAAPSEDLAELRDEVERVSEALGRRLKFLVGKPGLDGHSNGAEQIAVRARDAGMDVVYEGIRLTPSQIASSAAQEGVHVIGLSILSGSHAELIPSVLEALAEAGVRERPGRRRRHHPRGRRGGAAPGRRGRRLHPQGLGPERDDARHHVAGGRAQRRRHRRAGLSPDRCAELGARLREGDLRAAAAVLNLVESRSAEARAQTEALLAAVSPAALGGEAPGSHRRRHRPARRRQVLAAVAAGGRLARRWAVGGGAGRGSELAAIGRRAARATGRGSSATPPTTRCSSAPPRPATASAAWPPPPGRPPRRWPRLRRGGDRDRRRRPVRDRGRRGRPTPSRSSCSRGPATSCSS